VGCKEIQYRVIYRFRNKFQIQKLCELLGVSRSGYYKWLSRLDEPDKDLIIAELIRKCHAKTHKTYGYRRVKVWLLRETGLVINHKAVLRVMRKYGLSIQPRRKRFRHYDISSYKHYDNILKRNFIAAKPNEKWATDISYIATKQGFLYLSVIKDLYDNCIVGYKYGKEMPVSLVINTLQSAIKRVPATDKIVLHSDNGFHYTSKAYYNVTKAHLITPSMSSIGCPYDNACVESFFSLLKNECIHRVKPKTIDEAKILIDDYMYFYNNERIQTKTGLTPLEKRNAYSA